MLAYRRAFNYGTLAPPPGAVVYRNFHRQFVASTPPSPSTSATC